MAGLYVIVGGAPEGRIEAAANRLTFFTGEQRVIGVDNGFAFAWVGHDDVDLFGPAIDPKTGVRVITAGRVAWTEADWRRAETYHQYSGGLSNKLILNNYLLEGITAIERHNGPAALLIWDPRSKTLHLLSDHFGYHPIFLYKPENVNQCVIATSPDAIAEDSSLDISSDYVSMAEFLRAWRATPPHTYYKEIKYVGAATHWKWDLDKNISERRTYWIPFQEDKFTTLSSAAETLSVALRNAISIRTLPRLGPVICYVSGGMDSRTVLFSSASPSDVVGLNLYDVPNRESQIAKSLCDAVGISYAGFSRDQDYYPRWMLEGARISGGMWSLEDNHFLGTRERVAELNARTVLTACTTDWLFKGYGLEKTYIKFLGRNLPLKKFTNSRVEGFLPNYPRVSPPEFAAEVDRRMAEWFEGTPGQLKSDDDRLLVEDRRVRPACYTVSVSGQLMYRAFPYDTFLADKAIADCYSRTPAKWKLNADLFGLAVAMIAKENGGEKIVDANFGWRIGSSSSQKLLAFGVGWLRRRTRLNPSVTGNGPATDGSWPDLGWYMNHSGSLRDFWETRPPEDRELMSILWGNNPWKVPLSEWSKSPNDLFRILTLLSHWTIRRK